MGDAGFIAGGGSEASPHEEPCIMGTAIGYRGGTNMADLQDRRKQDEAVAAFHSQIEELRRDGIYVNYLDNRVPWVEAPEALKFGEILRAAQYAPPDDGPTVPGSVTLRVIEREVGEAGTTAVEREMLRGVRARIAAGELDGPHPKHDMDRAWMALRDIVAAGEFEGMLETLTQEGGLWAPISEDHKAGMIVNLGLAAGSPGTHTLAAIEREVDYDGLSPFRREALQDVRRRLDRGELDGEDANPVYKGDRVHSALRLAEFEARIEDYKRVGVEEDEMILRRWGDLSEGEKFDRIMDQVVGLHLGSEPRAFEIIAREVDMTRAPEERREFEGSRSENARESPDRDALLRETYRVNHELGYIGFRHQYFNDPDAIKEWPEQAVRERELRNFWDNEGAGGFASYCKSLANESVKALTAYRNYLRGLLAGGEDGQVDYYHRMSDLGRNGRLHDEGFGEAEAVSKPLPSAGAIADDGDGMLTPEEWRKLKAEWTHDYGLRHLEDRGVKYEDEGGRQLDDAAARGKGEGQGGKQGERLPLPGEVVDFRDNAADITDERIHQALADRHEIAITWSTVDVRHVRPNLDEEQAWEVLQQVKDIHDAEWGVSWTTLATVADDLFPKHRENRTPSPGEMAEDRDGPESPGTTDRGRERRR